MSQTNVAVEVRTHTAKSQEGAAADFAQEAPVMAARGLYPSNQIWTAPRYARLVLTPIILVLVGGLLGAMLVGEGFYGAAVGALISIPYLLFVRPKGALTVTYTAAVAPSPGYPPTPRRDHRGPMRHMATTDTGGRTPMRPLITTLVLVLGAAACTGDDGPTPAPTEPARARAEVPLTDQEAGDCMSARVRLELDSFVSRSDAPVGPLWDLVDRRVEEYGDDILGGDIDAIESLPPDEQIEALAQLASRFGRDADIAFACRSMLIPALQAIE